MTFPASKSARVDNCAANRRVVGGLLWERDYRMFWLAESMNRLCTALLGVALPLFALHTLHVGPVAVGLVMAATWAPWLMVGLPAGAWVDRLPRRPILVWASLVSAAAVVGLLVVAWLGVVTVAELLLSALLVGCAGVFASTSSVVYWPSLVSSKDLVEGNAKLQASESAALILGPSVGGVAAQAAGPLTGFMIGAVGFTCSAAFLLSVRQTDESVRHRRTTRMFEDIVTGVRMVIRDDLLRVMTITATIANLSMSAIETLVIVFLVRDVSVSSGSVGLLLSCWGVGGLIGALCARRVAMAVGTARTLLANAIVAAPFGFLVPLTTRGFGLALFAVGTIVPFAGVAMCNTISGVFRQNYCPTNVLGRITATMKFVLFGVVPLGALLGGVLGAEIGPRGALLVFMGVGMVPAILLIISPIRRMRDLPMTAAASASVSLPVRGRSPKGEYLCACR